MEILIKLDKRLYKYAKHHTLTSGEIDEICDVIANGTPLPKGHGELKDADAMINKLSTHEASEFFGSVTCAEIMDFINNEKLIIEADTESEE